MKTDKFGKEIKVGDVITYAAMNGDSTALRIAKVAKVGEDYIAVRGVWDRYWRTKKFELFKRLTRVNLFKNVIVLDEASVPKEYMDLLNTIDTE